MDGSRCECEEFLLENQVQSSISLQNANCKELSAVRAGGINCDYLC